MSDPRLKLENPKISDLIEAYHSGQIVLPEFQRESVWSGKKILELLDSLFHVYPISNLLLWQSSEADVVAKETNGKTVTPHGSVDWLIDGQQRLTSLANIKAGEGDHRIVFHPLDETFSLEKISKKTNQECVEVSQIWDCQTYQQLSNHVYNSPSGEKKALALAKVRAILDIEIPTVKMLNHGFQDAVEVFKRINTGGAKLQQKDINAAQVAAKHRGLLTQDIRPFLREVHSEGFVRIGINHLFRACAFIARPDGRVRTPLQDLEREEVRKAWKKTETATGRAIEIIRSELALLNMNILWSGALMVPVIATCDSMSAKNQNPKSLAAWVALAALFHRYSGSSESSLDQDLNACRSSDPIGSLLKNLRDMPGRASVWATEKDFAGSLVDRGQLLAMYIACKNRGVQDLLSDGTFVLQSEHHRHHILPRIRFPERERQTADNVANIAFIRGKENIVIGDENPETYLPKIRRGALKSHCIPDDAGLWRIEKAEFFWKERRKLLADSFNDFLRNSLPGRHLDG